MSTNSIIIILGIIILILVYILYNYLTNTSTKLQSAANLNNSIPAITIKNPTATRYAYGIWIYVNTWTPSSNHVLFDRPGNLKLYLDLNTPTLYLDMSMNDNSTKKMTITDNFPLQKWVYIIVSVDNQFVDAYLNGKLIQSMRFYSSKQNQDGSTTISVPLAPPDSPASIYVGNSLIQPFKGWNANVTEFYQWSSGPMDPQTAWKNYLKGNGTSMLGNYLGNYNANLQIIKNNTPYNFQIV
jgi:hypothetical protein